MNRFLILLVIPLSLISLAPARTTQNVQRFDRAPEQFSFRVVATGLNSPWEITWGPDNHIWATERVGKRISRVNPASGLKITAVTISEVYQSHGQDGLLGMALHPDLLQGTHSDFVYVAYTYLVGSRQGLVRRGKIRRYTFNSRTSTLESPIDLLTNLPAGEDHISGRLVFGPDQKLYFTVGDQGANWLTNFCNVNRAQELPSAEDVKAKDWTKYQGKILRLNLDGSIPADNPIIAGVRSHIYSYGHRNAQGLVFGPQGKLYASEHGPETDDEINIIESGKNYGWPQVAGYNDDQSYVYANWSASTPTPCHLLTFNSRSFPASVPLQKESEWSHPDFRPPLITFFTVPNSYDFQALGPATVAPSSLDIYTSQSGIPEWANSLLMPSLTRGTVYRVKLSPDGTTTVGVPIEYFKTANRYRDLTVSPDNKRIFMSTDNAGQLLDSSGQPTRKLEHPGAILEFAYQGSLGRK